MAANYLKKRLGNRYTGNVERDAMWLFALYEFANNESGLRELGDTLVAHDQAFKEKLFGKPGSLGGKKPEGLQAIEEDVRAFLEVKATALIDSYEKNGYDSRYADLYSELSQFGLDDVTISRAISSASPTMDNVRIEAPPSGVERSPNPGVASTTGDLSKKPGLDGATTTTAGGSNDEQVDAETQTPAPDGSPLAPTTPSPVGGGGGGGGGTGTAPSPTSPAAAAAAGDGSPVQIPAADEAQLWLVDGSTYLIAWVIPGTQTTLFYNVDNPQTLDAVYRGNVVVDRQITTDGSTDPATYLENQGSGFFGGALSEITNTSEHPWQGAAKQWEQKSKFVPWLNDPEVLAWLAEGMVEQDGRVLTPQSAREAGFGFAEGRSTQELTRELEIYNMTGEAIERERSLWRTTVEDTFRSYGITVDDSSRVAVDVAIDKMFNGTWDTATLSNEVRLFADPVTRERSALTESLQDGSEIISLRDDVSQVRAEVEQWVGPAVAGMLGDRWFESWAEQKRNDPNGQVAFEEALLGLRIAHFGAYGDSAGLRYADIASPVRGAAMNQWGKQFDESDPFFLSLVQRNDLSSVNQELRSEGMKRGIKQVQENAMRGMASQFGTGVLNPIDV